MLIFAFLMWKLLKNELKRIAALGLPLIFTIYLGGVSLFTHVHIVNGSTIVHSHPNNAPGHAHTDGEFNVLELITHFYAGSDAVHILNLDGPVFVCVLTVVSDCFTGLVSRLPDAVFLRGPPLFS